MYDDKTGNYMANIKLKYDDVFGFWSFGVTGTQGFGL